MAPTRAPTTTVLIVDDHRTFAEALALAIRQQQEFSVRVASGIDALEMVAGDAPDVVLVALEWPSNAGINLTRRIKEASPRSNVIVLSGQEDDLEKARAVEAGAIGYISKVTSLTELPDLLRKAALGQSLMSDEEATRLLRYLRHRRHQESTERQRANRLTPRQIEILQLMADGVPVHEIAERLRMSPYTLRTHVQNILTRLGVHTKLEALAVAIRHGKISTRV